MERTLLGRSRWVELWSFHVLAQSAGAPQTHCITPVCRVLGSNPGKESCGIQLAWQPEYLAMKPGASQGPAMATESG